MKIDKCPTMDCFSSVGALVLRLTVAVAIWPHGAQKVLGWFGGYGYSATYKAFTEDMGIWAPMAVVAILTEFVAPFFLVVGLFTRLAALMLGVLMFVAMMLVWGNGFFINWMNVPGVGNGVEYHLLFIGANLAIMLIGAGNLSVDRLIEKCVHKRFCSDK